MTSIVLPSKAQTPTGVEAGKIEPRGIQGKGNGSVYFVGTATTILEYEGIRIMTDPNFLHKGDHVHLGPGVTAQRQTNPAMDLHDLPEVDLILLSHYHEDHFDKLVEDSLRREIPIVTTPHAKDNLSSKEKPFTEITALDAFESATVEKEGQTSPVRITATPGEHVPPMLQPLNDFLKAVPPTNGWLVELGTYRIYISGDTLMVDKLKDIPKYLDGAKIDLMLVHLGGTSIPGASAPLLMVTMDAKQGVEMVKLMQPETTIPIHFDDYDVFKSPLKDFKDAIEQAGLSDRVVYLDRGDQYRFNVAQS